MSVGTIPLIIHVPAIAPINKKISIEVLDENIFLAIDFSNVSQLTPYNPIDNAAAAAVVIISDN